MHTAGATTLSGNLYSYNNANNISSWTTASDQKGYTYDAVDRLTNVTNFEMPAENYSYDSVGNRTASHLSASYLYQPFNKLTSTATATYSYDNNGNLTSKTDSLGTWTLTYDEENRVTQVNKPAGPTVNYKYDGLGRRIQRTTSGGANERYVYDAADVLIDLNADWSVATTYFNDLGIDNHLRQANAITGVAYFLTDHIRSTAALADTTGNVIEQATYDSFGNSSGSPRTRYGYTGRERDPDTEMLYYRARFYDPLVGRFVSEDPAGFNGGANWYGYVADNPVDSVDPMGLWSTDAHNYIIDSAFEHCLSRPQLQRLKDASAYVDRPVGQLEKNSYQHGMRGGPNQSEADARKLAADFVNGHEQRARSLATKGCQNGYQNLSSDALWEIGQALHTIMDETSPAHEGFQVWNGPPYPTGFGPLDAIRYAEWYRNVLAPHEAKETLEVLKRDSERLKLVKKLVREEFAKSFGDCGCCTD